MKLQNLLIWCYFWRWVCTKTLLWRNKSMHRQLQAILNQSDSKDICYYEIRKIIFTHFTSKEISSKETENHIQEDWSFLHYIYILTITLENNIPDQYNTCPHLHGEKKNHGYSVIGKLRKGYFMSREKKYQQYAFKLYSCQYIS